MCLTLFHILLHNSYERKESAFNCWRRTMRYVVCLCYIFVIKWSVIKSLWLNQFGISFFMPNTDPRDGKACPNLTAMKNTWATSCENLFMPYAYNKDADQPVHPRSDHVFVIRCLDSIISLIFYIRNFKPLASLCSWAGRFESCLVKNPRQVFSWRGSFVVPTCTPISGLDPEPLKLVGLRATGGAGRLTFY